MSFASPATLTLLLALPLLACVYLAASRRETRFAIEYPNLAVLAEVTTGQSSWRRHRPPLLLLAALILLIVGAARPQAAVRVPRERAAVVLAIDSSGSMRATDVEPTRMDAAREAARAFLDIVPDGLRVGIVSFDDEAAILVPPISERETIQLALDSFVPDGGTAIGDALMESLSLDIDGSGSSAEVPLAAIVLLSDGQNTAGETHPLDAAARARRANVPVYSVALGTQEGSVLVPAPGGGSSIQPVPPDLDTLNSIAEMSGGQFFDAPTESDLRSIYETLGSRIGYRMEERDVTAAFAGGAGLLAALAVSLVLARRGPLV